MLGKRVLEFVQTHRVDAVVLCDWGGFNGRLLPHLHRLGIPVLYYFPPRSWERTGSGGLGIARFVSRVATPFPWSAKRLLAAGCKAEWVGHPSLEDVRSKEERRALRTEFGVEEKQLLIALFPGSRRSELRILAPRLAKCAELLRARRSLRFIAVVPQQMMLEARSHLPEWIPIVTNRASDLLAASDLAIVKTGTATLEAALAGTPQIAIYDGSTVQRVEWFLLWAWKRIPYIAMPNVILQRMAVPEVLGRDCRPGKLKLAVESLLDDEAARRRMLDAYAEVSQALGSELPLPATERTVQILEEMLGEATRGTPARADA
jgi:lipid-A-disaccharide synthase